MVCRSPRLCIVLALLVTLGALLDVLITSDHQYIYGPPAIKMESFAHPLCVFVIAAEWVQNRRSNAEALCKSWTSHAVPCVLFPAIRGTAAALKRREYIDLVPPDHPDWDGNLGAMGNFMSYATILRQIADGSNVSCRRTMTLQDDAIIDQNFVTLRP